MLSFLLLRERIDHVRANLGDSIHGGAKNKLGDATPRQRRLACWCVDLWRGKGGGEGVIRVQSCLLARLILLCNMTLADGGEHRGDSNGRRKHPMWQ